MSTVPRSHRTKEPGRHGVARVLVSLLLAAALVPRSAGAAVELAAQGADGRLRGPFAAVEGHFSFLSDVADWSVLASTFGYAFKGGYRWHSVGLFLQVEHNMWLATEQRTEVVQGAINIGLGVDYTFAQGLVRTSAALGPSILAFDTVLDDAGSTGIFLDLRPLGLRWGVHRHIAVGVDPLAFSLVAPVLGGIPLVYAQYRTVVYVEGCF